MHDTGRELAAKTSRGWLSLGSLAGIYRSLPIEVVLIQVIVELSAGLRCENPRITLGCRILRADRLRREICSVVYATP